MNTNTEEGDDVRADTIRLLGNTLRHLGFLFVRLTLQGYDHSVNEMASILFADIFLVLLCLIQENSGVI